MNIILFGDIHLYRHFYAPWHLLSKRVLGQSNLWLNRRKKFQHQYLPGLIEQAMALEPDFALFTGDVSTTAMPGEFADTKKALNPITSKVPGIMVPGNHDRYTFTAARTRRIDTLLSDLVPQAFPNMRQLTEHWHVLALDGAVPRFFNASGKLGDEQLHKTQALLNDLPEGAGLMVMCHYPILFQEGAHHGPERDLEEQSQLLEMLKAFNGHIIYVHGHIHQPWHLDPAKDDVPFHSVNVGAPCMVSEAYPHGQGFWQIQLPENPADNPHIRHHLPNPRSES